MDINEAHWRAEVSFERLTDQCLIDGITIPYNQRDKDRPLEKWDPPFGTRFWAVLSAAESLIKTALAAIASLRHDFYGDAAKVHFESFWRSLHMIIFPNGAMNCFAEAVKNDATALGQEKLSWGTDLNSIANTLSLGIKLGIIGPINPENQYSNSREEREKNLKPIPRE